MHTETPYALYLKFLKPTESVSLIISLESLGLACLGEERIDGEFSIVHYHFVTDHSKKAVLHVEIENNTSERINISLYQGVEQQTIRELFFFLKHFDPDKTALIDQEIKNIVYIHDLDSLEKDADVISEDWAHATEKKATLAIDFDAFCENAHGVQRRDQLLCKS